MKTNKIIINYLYLIIITIFLGLFSRFSFIDFPKFIGDILWATLVYWIFCILFLKLKRIEIAFIAFSFSIFIELSQLYHAPLIDAVRGNFLGGIILGFGFSFCDIFYYFIGIFIGFLIDKRLFI